MDEFVHKENLKLYRKLLAETTDAQRRQMLLRLLADEQAKDERPPEKNRAERALVDMESPDTPLRGSVVR
jgi:hypothetical protein